ncbi:MAG: endonuclease Q family protein [Firmicutes bacterium]|nr:endonuclease Q family protein [Bacillota bacterium]
MSRGEQPQVVYADLHIHLGGIKMAAARDLTVENILAESAGRKGLGMVGIIDAAAPPALARLRELARAGELEELPGGGLRYRDRLTLIPGSEVEVWHPGPGSTGPFHLLVYLPGLRELEEFARWQATQVKNPCLSTQRHRASAAEVVAVAAELGGFVIPAHAFTPYKGILAAAGSVAAAIPPELWAHVPAVELGLSADTEMADRLPELQAFAYVANSDAHSLPRIAREYNALAVAAPTFRELHLALREAEGRAILAHYGLDPRLGKYHRSYCLTCDRPLEGPPPQDACPRGPGHRLVLGVLDRIHLLAAAGGEPLGTPATHQESPVTPPPAPHQAPGARRRRPPYVHQIPLAFVPGVGRRTLDRLLEAFGSEMAVLHRATREELAEVVGPVLAERIDAARRGAVAIASGAGGIYGRLVLD